MYGLGGRRGIVRTRALSFSLYVIALVLGIIVVPLVLAGPALVSDLIPDQVSVAGEAVLADRAGGDRRLHHHRSTTCRCRCGPRGATTCPGAVLTLGVWIGGSWVLRATLQGTVGGSTSIYGPLATPIAVLLWLYVLSIAVLIGAALNASFDRVFPEKSTARARLELVRRLRDKAMAARMREVGLDERGLDGVLGCRSHRPSQRRSEQLAEHHHRITLDEQARREGRQRDGARRRLRPAATPPPPAAGGTRRRDRAVGAPSANQVTGRADAVVASRRQQP